ncbi:PspC domain-containing protein [Thermophagus xiamenensis]|uniref:Phage shock protein C (PspC) family protein n=1 Tax=Thermophagus xiamenensis TaxID=385682 RepID=A0A1I2E1M7_9BACT|nr:PspC domain-containing protein [Thermophagus xiamenensis]SFE86609.1 phage shock protein C (PspC) family protein [Thermophagus xiamenensis]
MKKTIQINLAGHAFSMDEDAYDRLNTYLEQVKAKLGMTAEAQETFEDINLRIAELFRSIHPDATTSVTIENVEEVIKTLGDPADYDTPSDPDDSSSASYAREPYRKKQLFRDPDNRILGGVCSGLGYYFNIDPIIFRLLFILGTFFYASSILIYLILWIAIPKAKTLQQRIMMTGVSAGIESSGKRPAVRSQSNDLIKRTLRIISIVAGIILIVLSFISLTGLIMTFSMTDLVFEKIFSHEIWLPEIEQLFLLPEQQIMVLIGSLLIVGIPLLVIFYLGLFLVFRFKKGAVTILVTSLILWLIGIGLISYSAIRMATEYSAKMEIEERKLLELPSSDTIYIKPSASSLKLGEGEQIFSSNGITIKNQKEGLVLVGTPKFNLIKNAKNFEISIRKKSRGRNSEEALKNAERIEYFFLQDDSLLLLDRYFSIQNPGILRNQTIEVNIQIPENKHIVVADEFKYLMQ